MSALFSLLAFSYTPRSAPRWGPYCRRFILLISVDWLPPYCDQKSMTTRTTTSFGAVCLLLFLAGGIRGQELPRATAQYGAFAFPDLSGTHLLAVSDLSQPDRLHEALCSDGRRYPVQFERRQVERQGNNGRQTPYVFDKVAGNVFTVLQVKIGQGMEIVSVSCFLPSDSLLSSATWLPGKPSAGSSECGPDVRRRLASSRNRPVVKCWPIAGLPADRRLVLAEFARRDKDALASVVLIDRDRTVFADYPATFKGEGQDLWRVDDGGVLSPDGFRVVFLLQRGKSYVLGVSWGGSEGQSLAVFVSHDDNRFSPALRDYWYQAPI